LKEKTISGEYRILKIDYGEEENEEEINSIYNIYINI
jgi:hypothetical protein